ncbi:MAG: hypothetical protein AAGJ52_01010 [Pseudomonadota bacterium]
MSPAASTDSTSKVVRLSGLLSLALGVFGLLFGAVLMYASIQGELDAEQATSAAQEQARAISDSLAEMQSVLNNPEVVELAREALRLSADQSDAMDAAVQRRGVPNIIDLRIFPASVEGIPLGEYPEPDFTVIEMLIEARSQGRAPIQVHYPGQATENLALAQAVEVDAGVEGILFMRVPVSMASSLLSISPYLDSVSMVQQTGSESYSLRSFGQPRGGVESSPIVGSKLTLDWTRRTFASSFSKQSAVIVLAIGVIMLAVGLLIRKRFGALQVVDLRPKRKPAKPARQEGEAPAPQPKARLRTKARAKPKPAVRAAAEPDPMMEDLPDWLLDSDQVDQSSAPLGDLDAGGDDLPELPDTLSDPVDDTVGADQRKVPGREGLVADTVFFDPEENDLFEPESDRATVDSQDGFEVDEPATVDSDSDAFDPDETEQIAPPDEPGFVMPDDEEASAPEAIDELAQADDSAIGWDDFKQEAELEEFSDQEKELIEASAEASEEPVQEVEGESTSLTDEDEQGSAEEEAAPAPDESYASVLDDSLFRANSIGGIVDEHLDARAATLIGEAIGSEAQARGIERVVVGRDGRMHGASLMSALTQGLQASGVDVLDLGAVPIPVLNFAAAEMTDGSGIMVTGSHYPAEHNGFRIRLNHELLHDTAIQAIKRRIDSQNLSSGSGELTEESVIERYIERIGIDIQLERPLKVVVDCGNGIAGTVVPQALEAIGADVIALYADVDGTFPNHLPNPSDPDNLEDLKLCVRNFQADLGLAFDGDGDRLAMVSSEGEVVWTDRVMMLLVPEMLERNVGAKVVIDSASSTALKELIQAAGGKPIVERSAEAFVDRRMREDGALLGGLFSGHLFIAERWYPFDDAIYASARLMEMLAANTRPITEILEQLPESESTPEIRVPLEPGQAEDLMMSLMAEGEFGDGELSMVDGLRVDYADGWGLIRASHRSDGLVLRFEAESSKALNRIKTLFKKQVKVKSAGIKLLF